MDTKNYERLQSIKTLPSLVAYLRDDLGWPIDVDEIEDVVFDYNPEELGLAHDQAVGIKEIKQLRPMDARQPWGIFWVNFEKKRLPVVMLRRILGHLAIKKRASTNKDTQRSWYANDLLFISAYGEDHDRAITFAHFSQDVACGSDLPVLRVLGWDGGDTVLHLADAHRTLTESLRWPAHPSNLVLWRAQWAGAFTLHHREVISTTTGLVEELAKLATSIRKRADTILSRESDRGPLRRLYGAFKTALIHDLSEDDFADVIAQTISYGLLAARFSSRGSISIKSLVEMIPPTNPFLRELLAELLAVAGHKQGGFNFDELGIQDVVDLLNQANADAVKSDFGNRTRNEDPVIHFYEHFLQAYDRQKKVQRGVFFTPQPVVSCIVRSVHELLRTEFDLEDGLADTTTWGELVKRKKDLKIPEGAKACDPFVLILDPATGTATFLVEVIEVIFSHLMTKWANLGKKTAEISRLWEEYVPKYLLPRLYGYELMMAPYTIAHMKLALKLQEINVRLGQPEFQFMNTDRAHIYLTNSLEPGRNDSQGVLEGIFPALAHEAVAVNRVKMNSRFTVVIGNPPYANFGQFNRNPFILNLLDDYKHDLTEKKLNLDDDYIKFIRFAQYLIATARIGIIGMITNNVFLDGITHRQMRKALISTFSHIVVCDLHGSVKKLERTPDDTKDENVFDIQQGVGISLLMKPATSSEQCVWFQELWGKREVKYATLKKNLIGMRKTSPIKCEAPYFFFSPKTFLKEDPWDHWVRLPDAMPINATGVKTHLDGVLVGFSTHEISEAITSFLKETWRDVSLQSTKRASPLRKAVLLRTAQDISRSPYITDYSYRALDIRKLAYLPKAIEAGDHRYPVMQHLMFPNVALVTTRQLSQGVFCHVTVTRSISDMCLLSTATKECAYIFPLMLSNQDNLLSTASHCANLSQPVNSFLGNFNGKPQDFLNYAYAILNSPVYRTRYVEFLKIDFPRIPLTSSFDLFHTLVKLGEELVALHLMESPMLDKHITRWVGGHSPVVEKVVYSNETVWVNKSHCEGFHGVPESVWNFHIGGYQVCDKWLKDRKGRTLSGDDITHYHRIVVALFETIRLMSEIDEVIDKHGGWPAAFQTQGDSENGTTSSDLSADAES